MIDLDKLRKFKYAKPFKAFDVIVNDGRRFHIDFPFAVGWTEKGNQMGFALGHDGYEIVTLSDVVDVEPAKARRKPQRKKRRAG